MPAPLQTLLSGFCPERRNGLRRSPISPSVAVVVLRRSIVTAVIAGIVALEGIACGCVVIGSQGGGLKDAIGNCGLTYPNGDVAALA